MLNEKELNIIFKLITVVPKMSEFNKGYLLGMVESLTDKKTEHELKSKLEQIS